MDPFKNSVTLVKFMRSQGLEPTNVDWLLVQNVCAGELSYRKKAYNRCKYEHAKLHLLHRADRRECRPMVSSEYPKRYARSGRFAG